MSRHKYIIVTVVVAAWLGAGWPTHPAAAYDAPPNGEAPALIAVFPARFPPIFDVTKSGLPAGFGIDLMEAIAADAGLRIRYQSVPTWPETLGALRSGQADLIPNMGITPGRRAEFDFTTPVMKVSVSLFVLKNNGTINGPQSLPGSNAIVGAVRVNVGESIAAEINGIRRKTYASVAEAFFGLLTGEIDALIYPTPVIRTMAKEAGVYERLHAVGEPFLVVERAIAVRRGNGELLGRLNTSIARLQQSAVFERIHQRWFGPPPLWTAARLVYAGLGALGLGLIIWLVMRYALLRRLNRELDRVNTYNDAVLNASGEAIITVDPDGIIRSANAAALKIFGYDRTALIGGPLETILPQQLAQQLRGSVSDTRPRDEIAALAAREAVGVRAGGQEFPIRLGTALALADHTRILVCTIHDLSTERTAVERARFLTNHDQLTGLLNPHGAGMILENHLAQSQRYERPVTCINLGVARLTHINDIYGRAAGDQILVGLAAFLRHQTRRSDVLARGSAPLIARSGGDRFLIILPETDVDGAAAFANRLVTNLAKQPFRIGGDTTHIDINIGIAGYPLHGSSAAELLSHSETALAQAKAAKTSGVHVFDLADRDRQRETEVLLEELRDALNKRRLILYFQPIQHLKSGEVHHYETLMRIEKGDGSIALPGPYIEAAERSGLITRVDYRVLELVFSHLAGLYERTPALALSVNISGAHIDNDALFEWLSRNLREGGVAPDRLIFEITETAAIRDPLRVRDFMESLSALGCRFALDDFGVGFSSFSYLQSLPVDIVKIDGRFIQNLPSDTRNQALVQALTNVAHSLDKEVVAEYVEDEPTLELLRGYGVDYVQGFLIGRPAPDFLY